MLGGYFFVEGFEAFELGGEAAFGGGVDDEDDFAFGADEGVGLAFFYNGEEVVSWEMGDLRVWRDELSRGLKS